VSPEIKKIRKNRLAKANTFSAERTLAKRNAAWVNNNTSSGREITTDAFNWIAVSRATEAKKTIGIWTTSSKIPTKDWPITTPRKPSGVTDKYFNVPYRRAKAVLIAKEVKLLANEQDAKVNSKM
jgi:hypothetical protein